MLILTLVTHLSLVMSETINFVVGHLMVHIMLSVVDWLTMHIMLNVVDWLTVMSDNVWVLCVMGFNRLMSFLMMWLYLAQTHIVINRCIMMNRGRMMH